MSIQYVFNKKIVTTLTSLWELLLPLSTWKHNLQLQGCINFQGFGEMIPLSVCPTHLTIHFLKY